MLTPERLIELEQHFGGLHQVPRQRSSPHQKDLPKYPNMQGGDRMGPPPAHGYADVYTRELQRFVGRENLTIVEIGVLRGTGLAIWSKIFPQADIIGLDIDTRNFDYAGLKRLGAFEHKDPLVQYADQYGLLPEFIGNLLQGKKIDIVIDDGCHRVAAIRKTYNAMRNYLADEFVYIVEDTPAFYNSVPIGMEVECYGDMIVIKR